MSEDSTTNHRNRREYLTALGAGAVAALAGCTGDGDGAATEPPETDDDMEASPTATPTGTPMGPDVEEVVIGANHPLTGFLARSGTAMSRAGQLAVKHINEGGTVPGFEEGGIPSLGGAPLTFINGDNKAQQELGPQVHNELINEGAHVLLGCFSSPVTLAATQVSEREGIPHIIDVSVANSILQGRGLNWTYRIQTPASGMAGNYAEFMPKIARDHGKTMDTASLVYIDNAFGQSIRNTLQEDLPPQDVELVSQQAYSFGQESMNTEATKVKQVDADAFIFVGYGGGGIRMMQALQNVDYRPPLLTGTSTPTFTDDAVVADIGRFANYGFGNNYEWNYSLDWTDRVFGDYRIEFGRPLGVTHTVMTYTAVVTAANAINEAGSVEPGAINDALKNLELEAHPAAMGPITFKDNGENENALSPMLQVQDIEPFVVWPGTYAQREVTFPE